MQNNRSLLTIAIPTYNRCRFLAELLSVLKPQLAEIPDVELLISDNASTDDTPSMLDDFAKTGLTFRYIRNIRNLGPDENILQCFEEAKGKYVWVFGDDDIILPGAVQKIVQLVSVCEYDLVYLRPYEFLKDYVSERRDKLEDHNAVIVSDAEVFAGMVGIMFTFLGSMIVNKKRFNEIPHPPSLEFCDTHLVQLSWIFTLLSSFRKGLFVFENLIAGRAGNTGNYSLCDTFGKNLKRLSGELLPRHPRLVSIVINDVLRQWFPGIILRLRKSQAGNFDQENIDQSLRPIFSGNFRYWLFVRPLTNTPLWFAEIWLVVGTNVNRVCSVPHRVYRRVILRTKYLVIASS